MAKTRYWSLQKSGVSDLWTYGNTWRTEQFNLSQSFGVHLIWTKIWVIFCAFWNWFLEFHENIWQDVVPWLYHHHIQSTGSCCRVRRRLTSHSLGEHLMHEAVSLSRSPTPVRETPEQWNTIRLDLFAESRNLASTQNYNSKTNQSKSIITAKITFTCII